MQQLNLTIYGESREEILFYLLKVAQKMKADAEAGRIQEVRPVRGQRALTTMAKFTTRSAVAD